MTEEELEQKAREYRIEIGYSSASYLEQQFEKAFKDGYKEGQKDCKISELKNGNPFFVASELEKENAELKAQIEKMKCCRNCKLHFLCFGCENKDKWELAE